MEYKEHGGPVYALHRVFTLNEVDWPHLEVHEGERENAGLDELPGSNANYSGRMTPSRSAG